LEVIEEKTVKYRWWIWRVKRVKIYSKEAGREIERVIVQLSFPQQEIFYHAKRWTSLTDWGSLTEFKESLQQVIESINELESKIY
jgi:hypothetical protein